MPDEHDLATMSSTPPPLLLLPAELLGAISSILPNRDIKSLRLACRHLFFVTSLRLTRVFLSANPRNIEVFRAVAQHEAFRKQIAEVIWDDARLIACESERDEQYSRSSHNWAPSQIVELYGDQSRNGCPRWFWQACQDNIILATVRWGDDVERLEYIACN